MDFVVYNPRLGISDVRFDIKTLHLNYQNPVDYLDLIEHSQYENNFQVKPKGKGIAYKMPYFHVVQLVINQCYKLHIIIEYPTHMS